MKYFRFSWDEIMWGMSYANLVMLSATIPVYKRGSSSPVKEKVVDLGEIENEADFLNKFWK